MAILVGDKPIFGKYRIEIEDISFEEYLSFIEEDISSELRGGRVIITPPANFEHETIFKTILIIFDSIGKSKSIGSAIGSRFMVKLDEKWAPEPDVIFYTKDRNVLIKPTYFDGAPNIVVEILTPSNRNEDMDEKLHKYLEFGVEEVWIIDPEEQSVMIHTKEKIARFDSSSQIIQSTLYKEIRFNFSWIFDPELSAVDIIKNLDL